ncbi:putative baseplate assembly protein [Spirulina subsalsa FACHB-351]|uniref:Baseplate assembly protein n=1 Tax=Spirulina subsalsa FACHB-351 TaxID=234711 RepID=A0ABT3L8N2_9CYAN|nr:putative baseplate assembly protein [Spirulina subsalsa]MCW6037849.1 putative baseplate assembly protein [Spirulina subsalsa FACHB-351]
MEFQFLPNLPKANLDDRTFEDLIEECLLRIPRYCPEWTNYSPSDPGITLVELFAWLTDQMLTRFNQVPRRQYITFLELLGIRLQPPTPATTPITFYLVGELPERYTIPTGIEISTLRTATDAAIVFNTDYPLIIGQPRLRHLLKARQQETTPQLLRDPLVNFWSQQPDGAWGGPELAIFDDQPQAGNCFYFVFDPDEPLEGNVLAINVKGQEATPTGINPQAPPRIWQAWNGTEWVSVLLNESDDTTQGFSFNQLVLEGGNPLQGADVIVHLPQTFPVAQFSTYQGRWVRCCFSSPSPQRPPYSASPRLVGVDVRAIGGTVNASQGRRVEREEVGVSDGTPGQKFQLQETPILPRKSEEEYLVVVTPLGMPQVWTEVQDFADSGPNDFHYTLDSITGEIQFGPLIREAMSLPTQTARRGQQQGGLQTRTTGELTRFEGSFSGGLMTGEMQRLERQYGAIPPRGSRIIMAVYHTGGGAIGNVKPNTLTVLKSAVPYVTQVTNYEPAKNGSDAETLEQAVIRVPRLLRSRDRAVTPEDFETLALQAGQGAVARVRCLPADARHAGSIQLLVVPQTNTRGIEEEQGIAPEQFSLTPQLKEYLLAHLRDRTLLGIQVKCEEPQYIGVSVQTEISLEPIYNTPEARQEILSRLRIALYRFLNPLTGGPHGQGWAFGRPVYPSDIIALFQKVPGILYLGAIQLFAIQSVEGQWTRMPPTSMIDPGPNGLICSWSDARASLGHIINVI